MIQFVCKKKLLIDDENSGNWWVLNEYNMGMPDRIWILFNFRCEFYSWRPSILPSIRPHSPNHEVPPWYRTECQGMHSALLLGHLQRQMIEMRDIGHVNVTPYFVSPMLHYAKQMQNKTMRYADQIDSSFSKYSNVAYLNYAAWWMQFHCFNNCFGCTDFE